MLPRKSQCNCHQRKPLFSGPKRMFREIGTACAQGLACRFRSCQTGCAPAMGSAQQHKRPVLWLALLGGSGTTQRDALAGTRNLEASLEHWTVLRSDVADAPLRVLRAPSPTLPLARTDNR
eukprot:94242-Prymnesium_polylepis.1